MNRVTEDRFNRSTLTSLRARRGAVVLALATMGLISGCATLDAQDYEVAHVEQSVAYGIVESVHPARIENDRGVVGTLAGAAVGGLLGNQIGAGTGRALATIGGAVLGGVGGNALEHNATRDNGEEIVVHLDNNALVSITQGGYGIRVGDRVRVIRGPNGSRVERA